MADMPLCIGDSATSYPAIPRSLPLIDVTVLLLDGTFSSTAVGPMEVFRHADSLWNVLTGKRPAPHFEVTTASSDRRAVCCDGEIRIRPNAAIAPILKTDSIIILTTSLRL